MGVVEPVPGRVVARSQEIRRHGGSGVAPLPGLAIAGAIVVVASLVVAVARSSVPLASASCLAVMVGAALIDLRERRLPDVWVGAAAVGFPVGATATLLADGNAGIDVIGALLGALVMAFPLLVLHLASPEAMGFGDVKAVVVLGAALGAVDWRLTLLALCIASSVGALVGFGARRRTIPFGPFLVFGTWAALIVGEPIVTRWLSGGPT